MSESRLRKAAQEMLTWYDSNESGSIMPFFDRIRRILVEPEPGGEPVAWQCKAHGPTNLYSGEPVRCERGCYVDGYPLFTAPPDTSVCYTCGQEVTHDCKRSVLGEGGKG